MRSHVGGPFSLGSGSITVDKSIPMMLYWRDEL